MHLLKALAARFVGAGRTSVPATKAAPELLIGFPQCEVGLMGKEIAQFVPQAMAQGVFAARVVGEGTVRDARDVASKIGDPTG